MAGRVAFRKWHRGVPRQYTPPLAKINLTFNYEVISSSHRYAYNALPAVWRLYRAYELIPTLVQAAVFRPLYSDGSPVRLLQALCIFILVRKLTATYGGIKSYRDRILLGGI